MILCTTRVGIPYIYIYIHNIHILHCVGPIHGPIPVSFRPPPRAPAASLASPRREPAQAKPRGAVPNSWELQSMLSVVEPYIKGGHAIL